jgi:hypothetical protein
MKCSVLKKCSQGVSKYCLTNVDRIFDISRFAHHLAKKGVCQHLSPEAKNRSQSQDFGTSPLVKLLEMVVCLSISREISLYLS